MEQFKEIIDAYISNYSKFENGKIPFDCDYGELIFYKDKSQNLILYGIYIFSEYRQQGLCRDILQYLIDKCPQQCKHVCVQSVLSKILYEYLLRFTYKNKKFKNTINGFIY
jgi:hypothetical protein